MTEPGPKAHLHRYLQTGRDAVLWKLEGLGEYDVRRPLTRTGTNLLGLVKHLSYVEMGYFGPTFGRPVPEVDPWVADDVEPNSDMWAAAGESREQIIELYHRAWAVTDATVGALSLEAAGSVSWWHPDRRAVTLHQVLVHVIAETHRHAGHADIVRELVDGASGLRADNDNLPPGVDREWWENYRSRLEAVAREAAGE
jgi:hypothetical protein